MFWKLTLHTYHTFFLSANIIVKIEYVGKNSRVLSILFLFHIRTNACMLFHAFYANMHTYYIKLNSGME